MVKTDIRVIYGDTDQMGVVYHANYLRYFEAGRNEFLRAKGVVYRELEARHGLYFPVIEAQAAYKQPARYDDVLTVETMLARLGGASLRFAYRVLRTEALLATGYTDHACVAADGKVQPLPEAVARALGPAVGPPAAARSTGKAS